MLALVAVGFAQWRDRSQTVRPLVKGAIYTCPMHPEVVGERPGICPKCGMALEPSTASVTDAGEGGREL